MTCSPVARAKKHANGDPQTSKTAERGILKALSVEAAHAVLYRIWLALRGRRVSNTITGRLADA
jgi:hypothetical protein